MAFTQLKTFSIHRKAVLSLLSVKILFLAHFKITTESPIIALLLQHLITIPILQEVNIQI